MTAHDRFAAHELINRWWLHYDEGHFDVLAGLLTDDCHCRSRTDTGQHPFEDFIRSDNVGRDAAMAWMRTHREQSPYPLRHCALNVHVTGERVDEIDIASYILVSQVVDRRPAMVSSGIVNWTLVATAGGYRVRSQDVVLDSMESAPFATIFEGGRR